MLPAISFPPGIFLYPGDAVDGWQLEKHNKKTQCPVR
jgi:hypothetical protein